MSIDVNNRPNPQPYLNPRNPGFENAMRIIDDRLNNQRQLLEQAMQLTGDRLNNQPPAPEIATFQPTRPQPFLNPHHPLFDQAMALIDARRNPDVGTEQPASPQTDTPPSIAPAPDIAAPTIKQDPNLALMQPAAALDPAATFERNVQAHGAAGSDVRRLEVESSVPPEARAGLPAYSPQFNEGQYLAENADVFDAVKSGAIPSAAHHFYHHGFAEGRNGYVNG